MKIMMIIVILGLNQNLTVLADEKITESYIVKILDGKDQDSGLSRSRKYLSNNIPLLSFSINFSPETLEINKESYQRLTLISNIMNDKPLLDSKFLIVCCSDIKNENHSKISLMLSEHIKHFMMQNLSRNQERVIIRTADEHPSLFPTRIEMGAGAGRVEVFRVE